MSTAPPLRLEEAVPDVLVILEVSGSIPSNKPLRRALSRAGYSSYMKAGPGRGGNQHNGIVMAWRNVSCRKVKREGVAMRVEGIQVHCKKDGRQYAIAGIHGQFTTAQFSRQLDAVEGWLDGACANF